MVACGQCTALLCQHGAKYRQQLNGKAFAYPKTQNKFSFPEIVIEVFEDG
jgi:hypothetical protein